ncbi:hypothetical protein LLH03_19365 [bacterium]|nr:hypothetical protein [bacterium]
MRRAVLVVLLGVVACSVACADLPTSLEQFQAQIAAKGADPKASAKLFFDAVYVYLGGNKALGEKLITEILKDKDWAKTMSYFVSAMREKPYIFYSYAKGTTPENLYKMDPSKYELVFEGTVNTKPFGDYEDGQVVKLTLRSSGADSARPMFFERNRAGIYKVREFSSICVGVRPPKVPEIYGEDIPESTEPVWVAKHWLQGILVYLSGDKEAGLKQMNSMMKEPDPRLDSFHGSLEPSKAYIWRSYVKGATPENGYNVPDVQNFEIETYYQPNEAPTPTSTLIRMFVRSSGADTARPLKLSKDSRGQWRVSEYSSLCVGVRPPADPNAGDF